MLTKNYLAMEPIFFTPPRDRMNRELYGDAPSPPPTDPRTFEIMDKQVGLAQDSLDFVKKSYAENQIRQAALDATNKKVSDQMLSDAQANRQRSDEQFAFYKEKGRPVIEKALDDAANYDSAGNIQAFRGRAVADVNNAFGAAEQQQSRSLQRFGVMPNANRMATLNQQMMAQKAAAQAGAMTNSEQAIRDRAIQMRVQGANIANGTQAQAVALGQQASAGGQMALQNGLQMNAANMQSQQLASSGYQQASGALGSAGGMMDGINKNNMAAWNGQVAAQASENQAYGTAASLAGMAAIALMADGGEVGGDDIGQGEAVRHPNGYIDGPGTGTSDSVAAINRTSGQRIQLSKGEVVIPADTVRRKGLEFFEKLIEKTHTPSAIQRRQRGQ